ncbi:MAG: SDR family oxidoreductase [Chloroflexia bacterium]
MGGIQQCQADSRARSPFITGAAGGIGTASARLFAAEGASLALADLDADRLPALATELTSSGAQALAHPTDVSNSASVAALVAATIARFGHLDICFANGIGGGGPRRRPPEETSTASSAST